jgi:hypothetical protein
VDSPLERLLQADGATINLANQKKGVKDVKVSHTPSGSQTICPCRSLARLVDTLSGLPGNTALGTFRTATGTSQITGQEILEAVCQGARWDNLHLAGYDYTHIATHSLHSGGAMRSRYALLNPHFFFSLSSSESTRGFLQMYGEDEDMSITSSSSSATLQEYALIFQPSCHNLGHSR